MRIDKQNIIASWLLFIFWPFGVFIISIIKYFNQNSQKVILAFSFLYGYSVVTTSGDISRYEEVFYIASSYSWDDYFYLVTHFLSPDRNIIYEPNILINKPDIYALTISFLISRFTENPRWFWAIISFIYTSFFVSFINIIAKEANWLKGSYTQKVFIFGLVLVIPFFYGVIGVRFWPGLFVFLIFSMKYLSERKAWYIILAGTSALFHYSFIFPFLLFVFFIIIPNNRFIFRILIIISFFIFLLGSVGSSLNIISNMTSNFEETSITESTDAYTNEEVLNEKKVKRNDVNWYVRLKDQSILYFLVILGILDVFGIFRYRENRFLQATYPLLVLFLAITLLSINLGSIARFRYIFYVIILSRYVILTGIQPFSRNIKNIAIYFTPILILYVLVIFRAGFYTVNPFLLVNNSILTFFMHSEVSLSEFLVGH